MAARVRKGRETAANICDYLQMAGREGFLTLAQIDTQE